jgi:hypothetical protein
MLALVAGVSVSLSGCGVGNVLGPNSAPTVASSLSGIIHGGPNPVVGARVVLYATTSNGYGQGAALQEATQVGASAHQDTSATGSFSFAGGYTCPAGQYAYVVAYGGNSGAGNNPNSVLMSAIGPCNTLSSSTTTWIDELTTVAAGYALSNFINITGNAVTGYTVGIGSDATNNSATGSGCVVNSYYPTCTTTATAGLGHAFTLATNLVSNTTGQVNATTTNGAVIPAQLVNTLGNVLQACVNSTGGGTDPGTGLPTTATTSGGTTYDGTICGALSAFTSYTSNGTATGTLTAAGNTLGYIQNLSKRPGGSLSTFASNCASGSTGTTTAATCIFNTAASTSFYQTAMTAAPPDWMFAIFYPKASLNSTVNAATGCAGSPTTLGLLYPYMLATDINDNIDILNGDGSTNVCYNLITIGYDGTPISATPFDTSSYQLNWIANDSFGHSIVPLHTTTTTGGAVRIYATGSDAVITNLASITSSSTPTSTPVAGDPWFAAVDSTGDVYIDGQAGTASADFGYLQISGSNSHLAPAYTGGSITAATTTGKGLVVSIDINNNVFWDTSSGSGSTRPYFTNAGGTATFTEAASSDEGGGSSSNGFIQFPDTSGNVWIGYTTQATPAQGSPVPNIVFKTPYTVASGAVTFGTSPTIFTPTTAIPSSDYKIEPGVMDGNNVMWWADLQGSTTCNGTSCTSPPTPPIVINTSYLHGFDTVNTAYLPTYFGCEFTTATSTACGSQPTDTTYPNSYPYALYGVRGLAVDSSGNIWTASGTQGHVTEIIGMAAPTWPLFIHNGVSNKP